MNLFQRIWGYYDVWYLKILGVMCLLCAPISIIVVFHPGPEGIALDMLVFTALVWLGFYFLIIRPIWVFIINLSWLREVTKKTLENDILYQTGVFLRSLKGGVNPNSPSKFLLRAVQKYACPNLLFDRRIKKANDLILSACKAEGYDGVVKVTPDSWFGSVEKLVLTVRGINDKGKSFSIYQYEKDIA